MNPNIESRLERLPPAGRKDGENRRERPGKSFRILAVDDDSTILKVLTRILKRAGYTIETAENGRDAFEKFRGGGFDLVISDFNMPEMNGLQLLAAIKAEKPEFRVITHAGGLSAQEKAALREKGVFDIIEKPADSQLILSVVESALLLPFEGEEPLADNIIGAVKARVRVMFVDDDLSIREAMAEAAEYLGLDVRTAGCGSEALGMFAKERPDVVISDFHMPEMNGLELLKALRTIDPKARVIIVSGGASGAERKALLDAGAFRVLGKPFEMAALSGAINEALAEE